MFGGFRYLTVRRLRSMDVPKATPSSAREPLDPVASRTLDPIEDRHLDREARLWYFELGFDTLP